MLYKVLYRFWSPVLWWIFSENFRIKEMCLKNWPSWCFLLVIIKFTKGDDDDYNILRRDGSYQFGYKTPDSYHNAVANRNNVVRGEFGGRNPATRKIDTTVYTAGPRGYRPRGINVHRKYDLNQNGPRPVGSRDDPYFDPFEDPSYSFSFRTRTYNRRENANRYGDVVGKYNYIDDVGENHNVEFIAGKNTGFHVKTPFPDSNPARYYGRLYYVGRGKDRPRGRTSIQRGLDGSYKFVSAGPDQRRTEVSDATGHVRGSYTYLDDKGVQHSVHYIAGPETGYRVLKNVKGPHLPTLYPFSRPEIIPPDFYDYIKDTGDLFDTAASGPINNVGGGGSKPDKGDSFGGGDTGEEGTDDLGKPGLGADGGIKPSGAGGSGGSRPPLDGDFSAPSGGGGDYEDGEDDLFGPSGSKPSRPSKPARPFPGGTGGSGIGSTTRPPTGGGFGRPSRPGGLGGSVFGSSTPIPPSGGVTGDEDGSYRPEPDDDGSYIPPGDPNQDDGSYRPGFDESGEGGGFRPGGGQTPRPGLGSGGFSKPSRPSTPRPSRPSFTDDYDSDGSNGLFGSESSNHRPPRPTVIQVQGGEGGAPCERCKGTIVTNIGDTIFSVPPGVSVRAHVQSIDLLPLASKVPSPSEQYKEEMGIKTEQLNSAASDLVSNSTVTESDKVLLSTITTTAVPISTTTVVTTTTDTTETNLFD